MFTIFSDDYIIKEYLEKLGEEYKELEIIEFDSTEVKIVGEGTNKFIYSQFIEKQPSRDYKLLLALNFLKDQGFKIKLSSPYLSNQRQDKPTPNKKEGIALKHWINLLKESGVFEITSLDIHSSLIYNYSEGLKINNIPPTYFSEILKEREIELIIAPDRGASERAKALAKELNKDYTVAKKQRDYERGTVTIEIEEKNIENPVIIDDVIGSGKTIEELLERANIKNAILCITHLTISKEGAKRIEALQKKKRIKELITTPFALNKQRREWIKNINFSLIYPKDLIK